MANWVKTLLKNSCGNIAVMTALVMPVVMLLAGAGVDFQRWGQQRAKLQEYADMLALRGAREFLLANAQPAHIESVVKSIAAGALSDDLNVGQFQIQVFVNSDKGSVTVNLTQAPDDALILSHFSPYKDDVLVDSTAVARGGMNVCVIALEDHEAGAVSAADEALLNAEPCSVLSNSASSAGIVSSGVGEIKAGLICSAGGYQGPGGNFTPQPTADCPVYEDPLAQRTPPSVGGCDHQDFQVGYIISQSQGDNGGGLLGGLVGGVGGLVEEVADITGLPLIEQTINPGVYCGGLSIKKKARVTFRPGVYIIKDGPLEVGEQSTLEGVNIAFYLTGDESVFAFEKDSKITMSAPKDGPFAGLLFFEDRNSPAGRVHAIYSEDARQFLGTFYLPKGTLLVDTQQPVADASAYTAIVVRKLDLKGKPTLVLNADYASTDVPVPSGVGPVGGEVFLRD